MSKQELFLNNNHIFRVFGHTDAMMHLIIRTIVIFSLLLLMMRLLGKRQLGELELSELVVSILIADVASIPLQNPELPLWYGLVPSLVLFLCEYLLAWATMKSIWLRRIVCGVPCFLIVGGEIRQKEMLRCRFTVDELAEELRKNEVGDMAEVQYAILETDGTLNVLLRPDCRPVTAAQLGVSTDDIGYGMVKIFIYQVMMRNGCIRSCVQEDAAMSETSTR